MFEANKKTLQQKNANKCNLDLFNFFLSGNLVRLSDC